MSYFLTWSDGVPSVFQTNVEMPDAQQLTQAQFNELTAAIAAGHSITQDGASWVIADAVESLEAERARLNVNKLAFRKALKLVGFPGASSFLAHVVSVVQSVQAVDATDDVVQWWEGVQIFVRAHPDVETFRLAEAFWPNGAPMSEARVDQLFRIAAAIDSVADPADIAAAVAAFEAMPWS